MKLRSRIRLASFIRIATTAIVLGTSGCAEKVAPEFDEEQIKAGIEETAVISICPNQALLELAEIETAECRSHIAKLAPICWQSIDRVVPDYKTARGEAGKDRFMSIAVVYSSCVRGEILRQIVRSKRENSAR